MSSPNPNWPALHVQVAFNAAPNNPNATPTWTDLTARVLEFSTSRGRQYELDQTQAGEITLTFADRDEQLNPANTASPYYPNVLPYRPLLVQAQWPPAPVGGASNLVGVGATQPASAAAYDPTFESYALGAQVPWIYQTFGGVSPAVTAAQAWQGAQSYGWTITAGTGRQVQWAVPTIPGQQYCASLYVYQTAANSLSFFGPGTVASTSVTGAWTRLTCTWTATVAASTLVAGHTTVTNAGSVYIDALQVEAGPSASAFTATGPVIYPVFAGYIERWPSTWNHQGTYGLCQVTGVDALGVLAMATLDSELSNQIQAFTPTYYWPLWEGQGAQAFANTTLTGSAPLRVYTSPTGAGNGLAAGDSSLPIPGDNGGVRVAFTPGTAANANQMDCQILNAGPVGTGGSTGIAAVPTNPAATWSASIAAWAGTSPYTDTRAGTTQTLATLACTPQGSGQTQPLTVGVTGVNMLVAQGQDVSFETETVGANPFNWGGLLFGATLISNARAFQGTQSMSVGIQASPSGQGVFLPVTTVSGQQYTISVYVNQTAANSTKLGVTASSANPPPGTFDASSVTTTAVNTWVRLTVTFTATAGTEYLWVWCPGTVANNATLYVDALQMEAGPAASVFTALFNNAFVSYEGPGGQTLTAVESGTNDADAKMRFWVGTVTQNPAGSTTVSLQIDNTQTASATATTASLGGQLPAGATIVQVGGQATMGLVGQTWNGVVAHVGLWNTALSAGQMSAMYYAGQTGYGPYQFGTEYAGPRIARWLGYVFTGATAIDRGQSLMDTSPVQRATFALDAMNGVMLGEGGLLYADRGGTVQFDARTVRFLATTPKWVLGEAETPYEADIAYDLDPTQLFDDVTITRIGGQTLPVYASSYLNYQPGINSADGTYGGIVVHVTDQPAIGVYGNRQLTAEVGTASDAETVDHAYYWLARYRQPVQRLANLTVSAGGKPAAWATVLGMELNDRATVKRRTSVFTASDNFFIEKLDVTVNFAAGTWDVSIQASPVDKQQAWLLGDTTFGVLGSTTTLGW